MALPALRALDAFPIEHEGQKYVCLNDPSGTVEDQLVLTPPAVFVAANLTGFNDRAAIQKAFAEQYDGAPITIEQIDEVVDLLDKHGFLHTPTFEAMVTQVHETFHGSDTRPAYLAGKSYPGEREELRAFLDEQFTRDGGPGAAPAPESANYHHLRGLIVPHIDLHRGGHSYAHGYRRMADEGRPDTVFVFGVAHAAEPSPFILTRKHFDTPLGRIDTDVEMVDTLAAACSWDPFQHEMVHRTEHSIEFQAVMLAHLYGTQVKIVPILCSMFSEDPGHADPDALEPVTTFLNACRSCVDSPNKRVTVIAAADLAHVGKRFGDPFDIDDEVISGVAARDEEDLAFVHTLNPAKFYGSVMKDQNQRNVCGLNCIYAAMKSLEGTVQKGEPLHYDYAHDPAGGIVSFASVAFS